MYVGATTAVAFSINALSDKDFAPSDNLNGASATLNVADADPAMWFAVAAWLMVIVVVPAPTGVTCPDEFTVATLVTLLE